MRLLYYQPIFKYTFKYACPEDIFEQSSSSIFKKKESAMSWAKETWEDIKDEDDILIDINIRTLIVNPL